MIQLIITIIIIIAAVFAAMVLIIKRFRKKQDKPDQCGGCSSNCGECRFYEDVLKKNNLKNKESK